MTKNIKTVTTKKMKVDKLELSDYTDFNTVVKALIKKALGYSVTETVEEFNMVDSKLELSKRKVSTKYYPPDFNVISLILDNLKDNNIDIKTMTYEELIEEKDRLLDLINNKEEINENRKV